MIDWILKKIRWQFEMREGIEGPEILIATLIKRRDRDFAECISWFVVNQSLKFKMISKPECFITSKIKLPFHRKRSKCIFIS